MALGSSVVNEITLQLLCKLLELPESDTTVSELRTTSDIELLLDFILHVRVGFTWLARSHLILYNVRYSVTVT